VSIDLMVVKTPTGALMAGDSESLEAIQKLSQGKDYGVTIKTLRKGKFHRKVMALLRFAFDNTERVETEYKGVIVKQSYDGFRETQVIRSGHYTHDVLGNGDMCLRAHSLSYAECTQEKIEAIYSDLLDVVSDLFAEGEYTPERLDALVDEWMRFV